MAPVLPPVCAHIRHCGTCPACQCKLAAMHAAQLAAAIAAHNSHVKQLAAGQVSV